MEEGRGHTDASAWKINLLDPAVRADPFSFYMAMRRDGSVGWNRRMGVWMVVGYQAAREVLIDHDRFSSEVKGNRSQSLYGARTVIFTDPPEHTRLRQEVSPGFTASAAKALADTIRRNTADLLDRAFTKPQFDLISELAGPLPVATISDLLGIPKRQQAGLKAASDAMVSIGVAGGATARVRHAAAATLRNYFIEHVQARLRSGPSGDLLDLVCGAHPEPGAEEIQEMAAQCMLVLVAGHETTTGLLGNTVLSLVTLPGLWEELCGAPELLPRAVEEFTRFAGAVHALRRYTRRPVGLSGHELAADSPVVVLAAAANRDPEMYDSPDTFMLARSGAPPPLAFGWGPHYCLGAPLARLELTIVLEELLRRPRLRLAVPVEQVEYTPSLFVRGPSSVPLTTS